MCVSVCVCVCVCVCVYHQSSPASSLLSNLDDMATWSLPLAMTIGHKHGRARVMEKDAIVTGWKSSMRGYMSMGDSVYGQRVKHRTGFTHPLYPAKARMPSWVKGHRLERASKQDQTRPDQTRPDQTRPDQTRPDLPLM